MEKEALKARVNTLISQARTKQAMDLLWEHAPSLQQDLIQLRSRFNDNERRNRLGLLGASEYRVENNRIVSALLNTMKELDRPQSSAPSNSPNNQHTNLKTINKILFLASNPAKSKTLQLGREIRDIRDSLARGSHRASFTLDQHFAVRAVDLRRALLDNTPQIVHFAGHGFSSNEEKNEFEGILRGARRKNQPEHELGIVLEDDESESGMREVSHDALAKLFKLFKNDIKCVFLNACYSAVQAEAIKEYIPYVIGYNAPIADEAAIDFAASFYDAMAAGRDIPFAFEFAVASVGLENKPGEAAKAVLLEKDKK